MGILPRWLSGKESACQCRRRGFDPWVGKIPWKSKWQSTPIVLPGESHGQRSLLGYSLQGCKSQTQLSTHPSRGALFSLLPLLCRFSALWSPEETAYKGLQQLANSFLRERVNEKAHSSGHTGEGNGTPLQYSCLENPMWKVVAESREYTGILGPQRRRIQSGARDEAWLLRAFV